MTVEVKERTITVRQFEDCAYQALKARARRNAHSMEAEARRILTDAVLPRPQTLADLAALLPDVDDMPYVRSRETASEQDPW